MPRQRTPGSQIAILRRWLPVSDASGDPGADITRDERGFWLVGVNSKGTPRRRKFLGETFEQARAALNPDGIYNYALQLTHAQVAAVLEAGDITDTAGNLSATIKKLLAHAVSVYGTDWPPDASPRGGQRPGAGRKSKAERFSSAYIDAVDRGDLDAIAGLLRQAEADPDLGRLVQDLNDALHEELHEELRAEIEP